MRCEKCGGEVNLSVGRCTRCGRPVDEELGGRLIYDMDSLAERYEKRKEEIVQEAESLPELFSTGQSDRFGSSLPDNTDETDSARQNVIPRRGQSGYSTGIVNSNGPTLILSDYEKLMSLDDETPGDTERVDEDSAESPEPPAGELSAAKSTDDNTVITDIEEQATDNDRKSIVNSAKQMTAKVKSAANKGRRAAAGKLNSAKGTVKAAAIGCLSGVEKRIAPYTDKVLKVYHEKFPQPKRVKSSPLFERIAVALAAVAALAVVVFLIVLIVSSIAPGVKGEWLITETAEGERLTWEFSVTGEVVVRAYVDDQSHIYRSGSYEKKRKNGHNLLTITYEDGDITRLYYEIKGKKGTFINVDSNETAEYTRIRK